MTMTDQLLEREKYKFVDAGTDKTSVRGAGYNESTGAMSTEDVAPAMFTTQTVTLQDGITGTATSASVDVSQYYNHSIQFEMTTSHTTVIEVSVDGTNFVNVALDKYGNDISAGSSANNILQVEGKFKYLRVDTTAVSGALTVTLMSGN